MLRGRTRLTTPPGEEPAPAAGRQPDDEDYLPFFAPPREPSPPGRSRSRLVAALVAAVLLVAGIAYAVVQLTEAGRTFDPSLPVPGGEQPAPEGRTGG